MKQLILKIFETWKSGQEFDKSLFSEDFVYKGASKMVNSDVWLSLNSEESLCENVSLQYVIASGSRGALLFEWKDEITLLNYRTSWFVSSENGLISELIETRELVENL